MHRTKLSGHLEKRVSRAEKTGIHRGHTDSQGHSRLNVLRCSLKSLACLSPRFSWSVMLPPPWRFPGVVPVLLSEKKVAPCAHAKGNMIRRFALWCPLEVR